MARGLIFLVTLLLPFGFALADPPRAIITGPTDGVPGDLIELDSSESVCDKRKWYIEPARFADGKVTHKIARDGESVLLASRPGTYRVELLVSNADGPDRLIYTVTITGTGPQPPTPPPQPPVPPPPPPIPPGPGPLPAGRFGLAEFVRSQVLANVPADKRPACVMFAGNFTVVASQVETGTLKTLAAANAKLQTLNQATAGANVEFWDVNVIRPLSKRMTELKNAGTLKITVMDDLRDAYKEIAQGFGASIQ